MLCLLNILPRLLSAYLFLFTLLFNLGAAIVAIYYGEMIKDEIAMQAFSKFLSKDIHQVARTAAITAGSVTLAVTLLGLLVMMTPCQRKWMYYIYQPVSLLCFAVLTGAGLYVVYSGYHGASLLRDYCGDNFQKRWINVPKYGAFVVALDNTYAEMERTFLCSRKCPCAKIMFDELWIGPYWNATSTSVQKIKSPVVSNNMQVEYKSKYFNGTAHNVFACQQETAYFKLDEDITSTDKGGYAIYNAKIVQYLQSLEETKSCAGVCKQAYFYPFTNIQNGPPRESCFNHIVEDFSGSTGTYRKYGAALIISGMMVFLSWLMSFGVCLRLRAEWRGTPLALGYVIKRVQDESEITRT